MRALAAPDLVGVVFVPVGSIPRHNTHPRMPPAALTLALTAPPGELLAIMAAFRAGGCDNATPPPATAHTGS